MKYFKFIFPAILLAGSLFSCNDVDEFKYGDGRTPLTDIKNIPLSSDEKLGLYGNLTEYIPSGMLLGCGIDMVDGYMNSETYRNLTNANFNAVTAGYHMKHGAVVSNTGTLNFQAVDNFVNALPANIDLFGHTLVWHQNQNKTYLNRLIAPEVIAAPGENLLDLSALEDGTFTGWGRNNASDITLSTGEGRDGGDAVRMETTTGGNEWDTQLTSPEIPAVAGHTYELSFWIKSEAPGQGRVSFAGMTNNYPWVNGGALFDTDGTWQEITYSDLEAADDVIKIAFDLGKTAGVYYIDINSISVTDHDAEPAYVNLIANGTFDDNLDGWAKWNGADNCMTQAAAVDAYEGTGALQVENATAGNEWDTQIHVDFTSTLEEAKNYEISFMIKSDIDATMRCSTTGGTTHYQGTQNTGASWIEIVWEFEGNGAETGLNFDLGKTAATYYIDNVLVREVIDGGGGTVIINKTWEQKVQIIDDAMRNWITEMVNHYKNRVHDWDVVNEPMTEGGNVRPGQEATEAADEFYWQYYLGSDYAVKAFQYARAVCNAGDKLFINDYNLESNNSKLEGIINYVNYIEQQGQTVDGIGTQTHAYIRNADESTINEMKSGIDNMFQKLAATGKLVKVSELDIRVGSTSPSPDLLQLQSDMYRYVIESYVRNVPQAQRYGITIWGISDGNNGSWLEDDAPCVWDSNYNRKPAYMGVANGLAGYDVSADWDYGYMTDLQNQ
ncbi:MAG: endo-1,4-beta-xylanase [Prevotellaceae bacterium]|jgi:GH35 family endo-1,4-beta-xylanase|nr:endo-1,4-beta-xylanase [Prevotellaceae bacterium]